jgi:hypothetical protein
MVEINLDELITNNTFWSKLFRIINRSYQIDHIKYKKRNYFNCSNLWYDYKLLVKPCHKNHECKGYFDCDNASKYNKKYVEINQIEYIYSGIFDDSDDEENDEENDEEKDDEEDDNNDYYKNDNKNEYKESSKIIEQLSNLELGPKEIKFISKKNIKIINKNGFNNDHRGSDHTLLKLPFVSELELGTEFTLYDLLVANSNLKSHKFDNWYELYCGTKCKQTQNLVTIELDFDHGS